MIISQCKHCLKNFYVKPSWLKRGVGIYCSRTCADLNRKKGKVIDCYICGKRAYKQKRFLENSKTGKFFCSKKCSVHWHNSVFIEEKHANWKNGDFSYKRVLSRSHQQKMCVMCHERNFRVLVAHHIDHNRRNNRLENLTWLCLNCHHLVHNYNSENNKLLQNARS